MSKPVSTTPDLQLDLQPDLRQAVRPDLRKDLRWLVCPVCRRQLRLEGEAIHCLGCGRRYPVVDGIPVLLEGSAVPGGSA